MIGIGTCGAIALAIQQGQLDMINDAKRYRALRWMALNDCSEDERIKQILDTVPDMPDEVGDNPTPAQIDAAFDAAVAHLEANGVELA